MQILESMACGDYEVTTEGLFQSSAPESDYKEFLDICKYIADTGKMDKEDKDTDFNEKSIQKAIKKKPKTVTIRHRIGRFDIKHPTKPKDVSNVSIDKLISSIQSKYKLKSRGSWLVTTSEYGIELRRETSLAGPIGESSFIKIRILTTNYRDQTQSSSLSVTISKRKDKDMTLYNKGIVQ